jgi:hypothetical protein
MPCGVQYGIGAVDVRLSSEVRRSPLHQLLCVSILSATELSPVLPFYYVVVTPEDAAGKEVGRHIVPFPRTSSVDDGFYVPVQMGQYFTGTARRREGNTVMWSVDVGATCSHISRSDGGGAPAAVQLRVYGSDASGDVVIGTASLPPSKWDGSPQTVPLSGTAHGQVR